MGFLSAIPIIDRITKWIDEWKKNAALRKSKKVGDLREKLAKVNTRLKYYEKNYKDHAEYIIYLDLLRVKRVLERKIQALAR